MITFEVYRLKQRRYGNHDVYTLIVGDEHGGYRVCGPQVVPGMGFEKVATFPVRSERDAREVINYMRQVQPAPEPGEEAS